MIADTPTTISSKSGSQNVLAEVIESPEHTASPELSDDSPNAENYTRFPTDVVAKLLYSNELPGLSPEKTCQIIGKKYLLVSLVGSL